MVMGADRRWKPAKIFPPLSRYWKSAGNFTQMALLAFALNVPEVVVKMANAVLLRTRNCHSVLRLKCSQLWMVFIVLVSLTIDPLQLELKTKGSQQTKGDSTLWKKGHRFLPYRWKSWKVPLMCGILCLAVCVSVDGCRIGEMPCRDGTCLSPDKYCDENYDCPNKEDEPRHCTPCGRIYYGRVGKTYQLKVNRPIQSKGPQECNLTFVATGDATGGDIVQLSILEFSLGKFHSHTDTGCPHGHMQIIEYQRLYRHGYWCGNRVGMELYYSETPSVTVLLTMLPPDDDLTAIDTYPSFYFRMTYKFLKQSEALVRYGPPTNKKYTGIRDRTTVCNVHFHSCDSSPCYVQSPNFPGLYPRNTTCYYQLRQPDAVPGTRAVLVLEQKAGFLIHIKSASKPHDVKQRQLRLYEDCYYVDYVRVYDGNSTTSPVLITFCRGDALPEIISSGPNMLIEFTTAAFDEPDHEVPWTHLNGFELVARAHFLPIEEIGPSCKMQIDGKKNKSGWVTTPSFSLAPNTTCVWEFKGPPNHVVWLIFAHYWIEKQDKLLHMTLCAAELTIYDGLYGAKKTIGSYCHYKLPRVCDRAHRLKSGAASRPCGFNESYITSGSNGAISQSYGESTVVKNVKFLLRYEFVDMKLQGEKLAEPCDRIIKSDGNGEIFELSTPKSVFFYGRGGRQNMRCSWVLTGLPHEGVMLNITSVTLGNSKCRSTILPYTQASGCRAIGDPYMSLAISEWPWMGVEVPRSCVCSSESVPLIIESRSSTLAINLTIMGMGPDHDYQNFSFVAFYQFIEREECAGGERRLEAPAGELLLGDHEPEECSGRPWLLTAPLRHSLLLTLPRAALANESCASDSKLLLRIPGEEIPSVAICPSADPSSAVNLLWPPNVETGSLKSYDRDKSKSGVARLVVQWESHSMSSLTMQWLRLWSPYNGSNMNPMGSMGGMGAAWGPGEYDKRKMPLTPQCREWCPELNACIPSELWCDGQSHCPNGSDEAVSNCLLERIPWLYLVVTSKTLFILILITGSALRRRHLQKAKKRDQVTRRASTQESFLTPKDNHRLSAFTTDFTDMDFETTV